MARSRRAWSLLLVCLGALTWLPGCEDEEAPFAVSSGATAGGGASGVVGGAGSGGETLAGSAGAPQGGKAAGGAAGQDGSSGAGATSAGSAGASHGGGGQAGAAGQVDACSPDDPRQVPLTVVAQPEVTEAPFVAALAQATSEIRVMVYLMGYGGILDTLLQKAQAGVKVRVILDVSQSANEKYFTQLQQGGVEVQWSDTKFTYMHAKVLLVDDKVAVVSTGNYSLSYMKKERNFAVTDADPADLADLRTLFEADWNHASPDLSCTRLLVSPINARKRLLDLIDSAQTSLVVESMQLADTQIRAAIAARRAAGVQVRVLLADPSWIDANQKAADFLAQVQVEARYLANPHVHTKSLVVDGERAYVGSENFSNTSLSKNREVGLITHEAEAVGVIATTFEQDWAAAQPF